MLFALRWRHVTGLAMPGMMLRAGDLGRGCVAFQTQRHAILIVDR